MLLHPSYWGSLMSALVITDKEGNSKLDPLSRFWGIHFEILAWMLETCHDAQKKHASRKPKHAMRRDEHV
jgi:hypothetical protein